MKLIRLFIILWGSFIYSFSHISLLIRKYLTDFYNRPDSKLGVRDTKMK